MEKEFIPRELAIRLKDIGYDEEVFAWTDIYTEHIVHMYATNKSNMNKYKEVISIPTWQSVFEWLLETHNVYSVVIPTITMHWTFKTMTVTKAMVEVPPYKHVCACDYLERYEARQACLEKLIEIVEQQKTE